MNVLFSRRFSFKRVTSLVLALFVLSVLNMSFQIPVHAAMQQSMQLSQMDMMDHSGMDHSGMDHSGMNHQGMQMDTQIDRQECCPPALCDTVDAQQDQLNPLFNVAPVLDSDTFFSVLVIVQKDISSQRANLSIERQYWQFRQINPPPILLTTELQI